LSVELAQWRVVTEPGFEGHCHTADAGQSLGSCLVGVHLLLPEAVKGKAVEAAQSTRCRNMRRHAPRIGPAKAVRAAQLGRSLMPLPYL
jgi:hypothetical protein